VPLRINGTQISWSSIAIVVPAIFWLATLSFQVNANGDEIQKQAETKERLVRLEEQRENVADDISDIKATQKTTSEAVTANKLTLALILAEVKKE